MALDAGMVRALAYEMDLLLTDAKIEKIHQPEKDELLFFVRLTNQSEAVAKAVSGEAPDSDSYLPSIPGGLNRKLLISLSANHPRICLTDQTRENPAKPPMLCMQLRKYLTGAKIKSVRQLNFERAMEMEVEAYDAFGFPQKMYLIMEVMGKYSNLIFCDENRKILGAVKYIELSPAQKRPLLPGLTYELPPAQDKYDPMTADRGIFAKALADFCADDDNSAGIEAPAEKFICRGFLGISPLIAREIAHHAGGAADATIAECGEERLWESFSAVFSNLKEGKIAPYLIRESRPGVTEEEGKAIEYTFCPITQYGNAAVCRKMPSFSAMIELFYGERDQRERMKQRSSDILKLLGNAEARLLKKLSLQRSEIGKCADKDKFKLYGDVIRDSIYLLQRGMKQATLVNYYAEEPEELVVQLDEKLTPAQNSQRYYKKYNKAKVAEVELTKQIALGESELAYIYSVFEALTKAESEADLQEIRQELYESGYASKMKNFTAKKNVNSKPMVFETSGGFTLLCGKNNLQNDRLTTKVADREDYWFHAKNTPGSHVILVTDGREPADEDLTEAATLAAYYSKANGAAGEQDDSLTQGGKVAVDYTKIHQVRKPGGARPGFVTYKTNRTAYVFPDPKVVERLKKGNA